MSRSLANTPGDITFSVVSLSRVELSALATGASLTAVMVILRVRMLELLSPLLMVNDIVGAAGRVEVTRTRVAGEIQVVGGVDARRCFASRWPPRYVAYSTDAPVESKLAKKRVVVASRCRLMGIGGDRQERVGRHVTRYMDLPLESITIPLARSKPTGRRARIDRSNRVDRFCRRHVLHQAQLRSALH